MPKGYGDSFFIAIIVLSNQVVAINPKLTSEKIEKFIRNTCQKEGYADVVIGVSGGIDSATSLSLAVRALGASHVIPIMLPYSRLDPQGIADAHSIIQLYKIPQQQIQIIDIQPFAEKIFSYDKSIDDLRKGNIMARLRMTILYDLSKKYNALVVGTENRTEHLLGYYTRFGDEASDMEPLRELYKTQVYALAKYLKVPQKIIIKKPTAGLWKGQTDENEFGFTYTFADEVLYLLTEKKMTKDELLSKGYSKKSLNKIWWWIEKGKFKKRVPYILK